MAETRALAGTNQPSEAAPLWRQLSAIAPELGSDWRPITSAGPQYDPPPEPAVLGAAEIVEGDEFAVIQLGDPSLSGFDFFLDGIEMTRVSGYVGLVPIVHGYVAAVIRQRDDRAFRTWAVREEEVIAFPFSSLDPQRLIDLGLPKNHLVDSAPDADDAHPIRLAELGRVAVKKRRASLEAALAKRWASSDPEGGWLLVDGGLAVEPTLLHCGRAAGLVKSHRTQYLDPAAMARVLRMGSGNRTVVFKPVRPKIGAVYSWYLRLRPPAGHDIYWSLARLEGGAAPEIVEMADEISRWLMAEVTPLSMPDPRWHVLLYPIRDCEQFLRARMPTLAVG